MNGLQRWMFKILPAVLCVLVSGLSFAMDGEAEPRKVDLQTLYAWAAENDPVLKAAHAERRAQTQVMRQKLAGLLPTVSLAVTRTANNTNGGPELGVPAHYNAQGMTLSLSQSIVNFGRWADASYGRKLDTQAEMKYLSAEQGLILRVAEGYFQTLKAMDALEAARSERIAFNRDLDQTTQRYKVGLIAITDVEIAKARRDNAVAQEIVAQNDLENQKGLLEEIVGCPVYEIASLKETFELAAPTPSDRDCWVARALAYNFDLEAARLEVELTRATLKSKAAGHLPSLDVGGTVSRNTSATTSAVSKPTNRAVTLTLTVPIFAGGGVQAATQEASWLHKKSLFQLESKHREVERLAHQYYRGVFSQMSRTRALKQAVTSNQVAVKAARASFDVGTRTIVDVLDAQSDLTTAKQQYRAAKYDYLLEGLRLKQVTGLLSQDDVCQLNRLLVGSAGGRVD